MVIPNLPLQRLSHSGNGCVPILLSSTVLLATLLTPTPLLAQSITPADDGTGTQVLHQGDRYTITGGSRSADGANLFHSFDRLGLSANEIATFLSQPNIENILGRVTGGEASIIDGLLQVTGGHSNLYLINPAGILFGANARLDIPASFFATTATGIGFGDTWLNAIGPNAYADLTGNPDSFAFTLAQPGAIVNAGQLSVTPGNSLTLMGGSVFNTGTLSAPEGTLSLVAVPGENRVRLSQEGHLLSLELQPMNGTWETGINPLPFTPLSLPALLTGGNLANATAVTVNADGTIQLGQTVVPVQPGTAIASGVLDASNSTPSTAVPEINVLGDRVALLGASLNASGIEGGGTIRIGGDYQGQGTVFNADQTVVSEDSTLAANAINRGDGGTIFVWADDTTQFLGHATAQGGLSVGDGGFIEISGNDQLVFRGTVDLSASQGNLGTLLLDPENILVINGGGGLDDGQVLDSQILFGEVPGSTFTISELALEGLDGNANVILEASNDIRIAPLADGQLTFDIGTGTITFTADADNSGVGSFIMENLTNTIQALGRSLTITGASVEMGSINTGDSTEAPAGAVTITATTGNLSVGTITTNADADFPNDFNFPNAGNVTLQALNGAVTVGQIDAIAVISGFLSGDGGQVTINAGNDIETGGINAVSLAGVGNRIDITSTSGSITTGDLNATGLSGAFVGGGGPITVSALNGGITTGNISSTSFQGGGIPQAGGLITLTAGTTGIVTEAITTSGSTGGQGGLVTLTSGGSIETSAINTSTANGNGGAIALNAQGNIITTDLNPGNLQGGTTGTITLDSNTGDIFITDDVLILQPGSSITGSGALVLQPLTPTLDLVLGGNGTADATFLNGAELGAIAPGFRSITIGRADGSGTIRLAGDVTFNDPVLLQAPVGNGSIDTTGGTLTGADNATITLLANQAILTGSILNPGRAITITSTTGSIDTTAGTLSTGFEPGTPNPGIIPGIGADITLSGTSLNLGNLITSVRAGNVQNAGAVFLTATSGDIDVNRVDTQAFSYFGFIGNGGDVELTALNGDIRVADSIITDVTAVGTIDTAGSAGAITIDAPLGTVSVTNELSSRAIALQASTDVENGGAVTVTANTANLNSISTGVDIIGTGATGGQGADITLEGEIRFSQPLVTLSTVGSAGSGTITVNGFIDGSTPNGTDLTFNTGNADITVTGAIGDLVAFDDLVINSTGTTRLNGITATSVTTNAGGTTRLSDQVTTTGMNGQTYNDEVIAIGDLSLIGDEIDFNEPVSGTGVLELQPFTPGLAIALGDDTDSTSVLNLLTSELGFVQEGFSSVIIGQDGGFSPLTMVGETVFNSLTVAQGLASLRVTNSDATWRFTGTDSGQVNGLRFSNVATLQGGSGNDVFQFADDVTITGSILGGGGDDIFRLGTNVTLEEGIVGGNGTNTLVGSDSPNDWVITSSNTGSLNQVDFSDFQILIGGADQDRIQFEGNGTFDGEIQGNEGDLFLSGESLNLSGLISAEGAIALQANRNITISEDITTTGQPLQLTSNNGDITIQGATLSTRSTDGTGGTLTLSALNGSITTGDLDSSGIQGGDIAIFASTAITTEEINSSGILEDGGDVFIDPSGDVSVAFINAEGGLLGSGGDVEIQTGRFFRAREGFTSLNNQFASISTQGGIEGGSITIQHGGGLLNTPFTIGDETTNGTAGVITSGDFALETGESYFDDFTEGNINLITDINSGGLPEPPPPPIDPTPPESPDLGSEPNVTGIEATVTPRDDERSRRSRSQRSETVAAAPTTTSSTPIQTPQFAQQTIRQVITATGTQPAIIYVRFAPAGWPSRSDALELEATATQQFAQYLDQPDLTVDAGIALEPEENDQLELLLVTGNGDIIVKQVDVTRGEVQQAAKRLIREITDQTKLRTRSYMDVSQRLYRWIVAPLEADLQAQQISNLVFIMDTGLRSLPLAALHNGQQFLVERYSVGLMPSLSLTDTSYVNIQNTPILSMGASEFTGLPDLPSVPLELSLIQTIEGGVSYLNQGFTIENLRAERWENPFSIVHLATHGEFNPGSPANSYIQFWDERLLLEDIRQLGLNDPPVELLVLSACRTALGDEQAELGFAGFAVQAGVKSVLASLWYVSDTGTLALMTQFYHQLRQAPIKAEALQEAQIAMLKGEVRIENGYLLGVGEEAIALPPTLADQPNTVFSHPYFWASFTMIGNPW